MHTKFMIGAFLLLGAPLFSQQQDETLFRNARLSGGFCAPIFAYGKTNGHNVYGAGGGLGLVFNQFFIGAFGMGEVFSTPKVNGNRLNLGYGGLWMGYTFPTHKLAHLYASVKIAGGGTGTSHFDGDEWHFDDDLNDAVFVGQPEVGVELNIARWMRLSGSVGYRYVGGFSGWETLRENDLSTPLYSLTLRFGWFARR